MRFSRYLLAAAALLCVPPPTLGLAATDAPAALKSPALK